MSKPEQAKVNHPLEADFWTLQHRLMLLFQAQPDQALSAKDIRIALGYPAQTLVVTMILAELLENQTLEVDKQRRYKLKDRNQVTHK